MSQKIVYHLVGDLKNLVNSLKECAPSFASNIKRIQSNHLTSIPPEINRKPMVHDNGPNLPFANGHSICDLSLFYILS